MISVPLVTMNQNSRSLGTFVENFKDTIHFESYNDKILDNDVNKVVVFFEYLGDNDYVFKTFVNYFETYTKPTFLVIDDSYEGLADIEFLKNAVSENNADFGLALDGDGDRLIFVSKDLTEIDGDQILYLLTPIDFFLKIH